jgi:hypothetical protein
MGVVRRLLTAWSQVRVLPPEPLTNCVRPVNTLIGRHVPDGNGFQLPAVDVDGLEEVPDGGDPGFERGAFQDACKLRNGFVDHPLRDPVWSLR